MTPLRTALARLQRRSGERDAGVTLIEVVIATVIFGIMSSAVLAIVISAQAKSVDNRNRVAAANLAAREIEFVREQFMATDSGPTDIADAGTVVNAHPLGGGTAGDPLELDGTAYTVTRSVAWNVTGTGESACEGGALVEHPSLVVTVRVSWPGMGVTKPVENQAVFAPERGLGLPTAASFAAVAVYDAAGEPNVGRTVLVSSPYESRSGLTDHSGCAVIQLAPPASGAEYTATFPDSGYIDITGTTSPSRAVGLIGQGQLAHNVEIALDQAASVTIRVTGGVSDAEASGATVSLYQSESSGSAILPTTLTGVDTVVTGLWPTDYTAFFGTELPPVMPDAITLLPGSTGVLEVPFQFAEFVVTGAPSLSGLSTGQVRATAPGGTCTDAGARTIDPGDGKLLAGSWDFHSYSADWGCAAGPTGVGLNPGPNGDVVWSPSTLTVSGGPSEPIWVSPAATGAACSATAAVRVSGGSGFTDLELPAGDWYVFSAPDTGSGPGTPCVSAGLVAVPYGGAATYLWPAGSAAVTVDDLGTYSWNRTVLASQTPITYCDATTHDGTGTISFTYDSVADEHYANLPAGTWYLAAWRKSPSPTCFYTAVSPLTVADGGVYSVHFDSGTVTP